MIMVGEKIQTQKAKEGVFSLICGIQTFIKHAKVEGRICGKRKGTSERGR
jgi:hypothetical protein